MPLHFCSLIAIKANVFDATVWGNDGEMVMGPFVLEELGNTATPRGVARAGPGVVDSAHGSNLPPWLSQESWLPAAGGGGLGSGDGGRGAAITGRVWSLPVALFMFFSHIGNSTEGPGV